MIGEHDQQRVLVNVVENRTEQCVAALVMLLDTGSEIAIRVAVVHGMANIAESPHHVLKAIRSIEEHEEKTFLHPVQFEPHELFALAENQVTMLEISLFIKASVVQSVVVFSHAKGREHAQLFGDGLCVIGGRGYGKQGSSGIEVDG